MIVYDEYTLDDIITDLTPPIILLDPTNDSATILTASTQ